MGWPPDLVAIRGEAPLVSAAFEYASGCPGPALGESGPTPVRFPDSVEESRRESERNRNEHRRLG